jgi:hypothetical protein
MDNQTANAVIGSAEGFFEALDNNLLQNSHWLVTEEAEPHVRLWLEESENRDWTFLMPEEPVDGFYTVCILER